MSAIALELLGCGPLGHQVLRDLTITVLEYDAPRATGLRVLTSGWRRANQPHRSSPRMLWHYPHPSRNGRVRS